MYTCLVELQGVKEKIFMAYFLISIIYVHAHTFFFGRPVTFSRRSLPLWLIALIVFGVLAILGITIGLLVHFLAIGW